MMIIDPYCMFVELRRGEALFHRAAIGEVGIPWKLERNGIRFLLPGIEGNAEDCRQRAADINKVKRFDEIVKENRRQGHVSEALANLNKHGGLRL